MNEQSVKRITLKEVAKATGFTINTVSRALMGMSDISTATTELIREKAAEMGYVRNHMASALRSGSTHTLALIVGHLVNPYFATIFDNVELAAEKLGYTLMLFSSHEQVDHELGAIRTAISHHADGIILFPSQENAECLELLRSNGIPFVIFARDFDSESADFVLSEEEQGGYLAAKHLLDQGYRKLIYVYDSYRIHSINLRQDGFIRACREAAIPESDIRIIQNLDADGNDNAPGTAERIAGLYRLGFNGVVAFCDMVARRLIAQLRILNLRVPEDIGIVGFDNTDEAVPATLPLCSIDGNCEGMSEAAVNLINKRIHGEKLAPQKIVFPVHLICRGSCAPTHPTGC